MNSRIHLTPSVTTDRNGKVTTVYRKPDQSGPARGIPSTPPAPAGASRFAQSSERRAKDPGRQPKDMAIDAALHDAMVKANKGRELGRDKMVFALRATDGQAVLLTEALENKDGFGALLNGMIDRFSPGQAATIAAIYRPEVFDYFESPYVKTKTQRGLALSREASDLYHGLRRCHTALGLTPEEVNDLSIASPAARARAEGYAVLFGAARSVDDKHEPPLDLVRLAFGESTPEAVAKAVKETGSTDAVVIRGVVAGAHTSIAEGYL